MKAKRFFLHLLLPTLFGVTAALALSARGAEARGGGCEMNACRTTNGNCDLIPYHLSCVETEGGCETTGCSPN